VFINHLKQKDPPPPTRRVGGEKHGSKFRVVGIPTVAAGMAYSLQHRNLVVVTPTGHS
jgi:hypothetical protein